MPFRRRLSLALALALTVGAAAGCAPSQPADDALRAMPTLQSGAEFADRLRSTDAASLSDQDVIALGYLERARRGLSSPFRLADYARRDRRLTEERRAHLALAILGEVVRGRVYELDPAAIAGLRFSGSVASGWHARQLLRTVGEMVDQAPSAATGDAVARLALQLSLRERTLLGDEALIAPTAALMADRRIAREDVSRLITAAGQNDIDLLELLGSWRAERRFLVERPRTAAPPLSDELVRAAVARAATLRNAAQQMRDPLLAGGLQRQRDARVRSWLTPESAERLARLAAVYDHPPQSPRGGGGATPSVRRHRERIARSPASPRGGGAGCVPRPPGGGRFGFGTGRDGFLRRAVSAELESGNPLGAG